MSDDLDREMAEFERETIAKASAPTAEQGSAQWLAERVGHCTASRFADAMDFLKKGGEGAKRAAYRMELVIERLTGHSAEHYVSDYMQWGIEQEPAARMAYEAHTGAMVIETGFRHHPTIARCGGSVDGLVGEDGMIEIKCPATGTHIKTLLGAPCDHLPQIQGYLWITGRKWCDFVSFDPRLPDGLQLFVQRIARDDAYIADLARHVQNFLAEVGAMEAQLLAMKRIDRETGEIKDDAFDLATQA